VQPSPNAFDLLLFVVNDSLDDILGESGDEEEQDAVVSQVLDEIGIEISGKVCTLVVVAAAAAAIASLHHVWNDKCLSIPTKTYVFLVAQGRDC